MKTSHIIVQIPYISLDEFPYVCYLNPFFLVESPMLMESHPHPRPLSSWASSCDGHGLAVVPTGCFSTKRSRKLVLSFYPKSLMNGICLVSSGLNWVVSRSRVTKVVDMGCIMLYQCFAWPAVAETSIYARKFSKIVDMKAWKWWQVAGFVQKVSSPATTIHIALKLPLVWNVFVWQLIG